MTGYGENGTGDANDVWRLEIIDGKEGEILNTVTTKLKFHHYFVKCVLTCSTKPLPKWGFEQGEVSCNPTIRDPNSLWNIEDNFFAKLPNSSVRDLAPSFFSRFFEAHKVMLQGNSGLKPKEGELTSRPWEWPINLRGQWFSAGDDSQHRVYLLGNPLIWWANIVFLVIFLIMYFYSNLKTQRGVTECPEAAALRETTLVASAWFFLGWCLHYIPFWAMGRVLYIHHYYPALLFSSMLSAVLIDYMTKTLSSMLPASVSSTTAHTILAVTLSSTLYTFYLFSSLAYGMNGDYARESNSTKHSLQWMNTWEF